MEDKDITQTDVTGAPGNTGASNENGEVDVGDVYSDEDSFCYTEEQSYDENRHLKILTHHMPCIYPG